MLIQMKAGSRAYWEKAEALTSLGAATVEPGRAGGSVLTVRADPTMVYQFRALARNSAGISAPGAASPPTMVNRFYAALLEPPKPTATSSASYTVSWGATLGACQPDVRWDLLYSRVVDDDWHSVADNVATESVELPALRCADGCVFKARTREVEGFSGYSKNSAPLPTNPLPQARAGAIRLEMRLELPRSGSSGADDPSERSDGAIARGLATLAEVPEKEAVSIVERRCVLDDGACFFVFDLTAFGDTARAMGAARNLARALQGRDTNSKGGATEALRDIDLQYGLRLISQGSDVTQRIEPSVTLTDRSVSALATLRSVAGGVTRLAFRSPMAVLSLVAALGFACCAYCCCRICLRGRFHTHSKIRQDDDDDDAWPEDAHEDGTSDHWRDDIYGRRCDNVRGSRDNANPKGSSASANTRCAGAEDEDPTYQI